MSSHKCFQSLFWFLVILKFEELLLPSGDTEEKVHEFLRISAEKRTFKVFGEYPSKVSSLSPSVIPDSSIARVCIGNLSNQLPYLYIYIFVVLDKFLLDEYHVKVEKLPATGIIKIDKNPLSPDPKKGKIPLEVSQDIFKDLNPFEMKMKIISLTNIENLVIVYIFSYIFLILHVVILKVVFPRYFIPPTNNGIIRMSDVNEYHSHNTHEQYM